MSEQMVTDIVVLVAKLKETKEKLRQLEAIRDEIVTSLISLRSQIDSALNDKEEKLASIPIESMEADLNAHVLRCLKDAKIDFVGQLTNLSEHEIKQVPNLGPNGFPLIMKALTARGLMLKQTKNGRGE